MSNSTHNQRPPLSPGLLDQADDIERGMCFGHDGTDELIIVYGVEAWQVVTWRGNHDEEADTLENVVSY